MLIRVRSNGSWLACSHARHARHARRRTHPLRTRNALLHAVLALSFAPALASCTSDTAPKVYMNLAYQVRCLDCQPRAADGPAREVNAVDGEDGYTLSCSVSRSGGMRRVSLSVSHLDSSSSSTDQVFKISGANLDGDTSDCTAHVVDSGNTFDGACSSDTPDVSGSPCQIMAKEKSGVITGSLYCANIQSPANLDLMRYIVAPGSRTDPGTFEVHGCSGL